MSARRPATAALAAAALVAVGGLAALVLARRGAAPDVAPAVPTPVEEQVAAWRSGGIALPEPSAAAAHEALSRGLAALDGERPAEALAAFRAALAADPGRLEAVSGYATAVADVLALDPDADQDELRVAHALLAHARAAAPDRADVLAAYARLLLAVPSAANDDEARQVAARALAAAPGDRAARLAVALSDARTDPAAGAALLETAMSGGAGTPALRSTAARLRWAAGDAGRALALVRAAAATSSGPARALRVELELAADLVAEARATLGAWEAADPGSPLPPLLLARIAHQRDGDLPAARRHLDEAMTRAPRDFTAARIHAHRAAVARAAGDREGALAEVAAALRRVPGSAPARFQEALLAFDDEDAATLRRAAGVLGERAGPLAAKLLAARAVELSGDVAEAIEAYRAAAAAAPRDPATLLGIAGALARLGAPGAALGIARAALAHDPLDGRVERAPTDFWEGRSPVAEAARRLEAVGRAEPSAAPVAFAAASSAALLLGRTVDAERLARAAWAASPQAAAPGVLLAQVALDRGAPAKALAYSRAAVSAVPEDAAALSVHGRVLHRLGRWDEAERALRAAVDRAPDGAAARLCLAELLARRGHVPEVKALLEAVLADDPGNAAARRSLLTTSAALATGG